MCPILVEKTTNMKFIYKYSRLVTSRQMGEMGLLGVTVPSKNIRIDLNQQLIYLLRLGKLLNQLENQKLLGLALSTTFGRPLRYCIQYEIAPAASYWTYYADQLDSYSTQQVLYSICVQLFKVSYNKFYVLKDEKQYCCCYCGII